MSLVNKALVNQYMVSTDAEASQQVVQDLEKALATKELSLLDFVKNLGTYLTDGTDSVRARALMLLASVLSIVKASLLYQKDTLVLFKFFAARLEDSACTKEVLKGFDAIVKMDEFSDSQIAELLHLLQEVYTPVGQLASTRYEAFVLLDDLLDQYKEQLLTTLNDEYIDTFIKVTTGEKDPKNLMASFKLNRRISVLFDIGPKQQELFDCVFCYFPISFRAPANNPYDVTGDDLKTALRDCLCSNDLYAKDSFPNLVEKLASTSPTVKLDVLLTIRKCVESYSAATVEEYWLSLWNSLKFEILHRELASAETIPEIFNYYENAENEDEQTVAITLHIFESLSAKYTAPKDQDGYADYLVVVFDSLSAYLQDMESTKVRQASVIMSVICGAQIYSYNLLLGKTFDALFKTFHEKPEDMSIRSQRVLLSSISFILDSYYKLFNEQKKAVLPSNPIFQYKEDILMVLSRSLLSTSSVEVTLRCLAIKVITKLFGLNSLLENQECELIVQTLDDVLIDDSNPNTFEQALQALATISKDYSTIILEYTVPRLLVMLPDTSSQEGAEMSKEKVLDILLTISENKQVISAVLVRLLSKLEAVLQTDDTYYSHLLLLSISKVLGKLQPTDSTNDYLNKFLPRFLWLALSNELKDSPIHEDYLAAEYSSRVVRRILKDCDLSHHQRVLDDAFDLFGGQVTQNSLVYKQLDQPINAFGEQTCVWPILSGIISTVSYKDTKLPEEPSVLIDNSEVLISSQLDLGDREAVLETISLVVNKWLDDKEYLGKKFESLKSQIASAAKAESVVELSKPLEVLTWIAKALMLKNSSVASEFIDYLVSLLEQKNIVSKLVPKCFEILGIQAECYEECQKEGSFGKMVAFNVNIRKFYKQKFVDSTLPVLVDKFSESHMQNKDYLKAISVIIKYSDKQIIATHLDKVMPVVLTALQQRSGLILSAALNILEIAIEESPDLIKSHLSTLVLRLLQILQTQGPSRSEPVKQEVLECLMALSKFPLQVMTPYRSDILTGCESTLDDDRRTVRHLACECRQQYYELGIE